MLNPKIYNKSYFYSTKTEGFLEFIKNKLSPIRKIEIKLLNLKKKDLILEIGCGRGDIVRYLYQNKYKFKAIDYSKYSITATKILLPKGLHKNIVLCDAKKIPFPDRTFTKILLADVIEHMTYTEAVEVLNETFRLLKKGGLLLTHTSPNALFKKYIYPTTKALFKLTGQTFLLQKLNANIQATYIYHVDEYSISDLNNILKISKFNRYKTWVNPDVLRYDTNNYLNPLKRNPVVRLAVWIINHSPLLYLFGNDLFALAYKK